MIGLTTSVDDAARDARECVADLAGAMRRLGERHAADHDVLHLSRTLGLKLDEAAAGIAAVVGEDAAEPAAERDGGPLSAVRRRASSAVGTRLAAGGLLLADLRRFLGDLADASVTCTIAEQGAKAAGRTELLAAVQAAHATVQRTHRWALTRLKTTVPQVLTGP